MSSDKANHYEKVITTEPVSEPVDDVFVEYDPLDSLELQCVTGQSYSTCDRSSESNNFENNFSSCFIKEEHEDSGDEVRQAENLVLKKEIDIEEHKPALAPMGSPSNAGIFEDELDHCDCVHENEFQSSKSNSDREEKFICPLCPYKTNIKLNFIWHNRTHNQCTQLYEYTECPYNNEIKCNHNKCKHSKAGKVYNCQQCSYETTRKDHLKLHFKSKHSEDTVVYNCPECSYETKRKDCLTVHYKCKHAKEAEMYSCQDCSFRTKNKSNFTQHHKRKHSKDAELYKCVECSYEITIKSELTRHYKRKHGKDVEVYKCDECPYKTQDKGHFTRHYKSRHAKYAVVNK